MPVDVILIECSIRFEQLSELHFNDVPRIALYFQLYPTGDRRITRELVERAEAAGCQVLVLTVDTPITGNRELKTTSGFPVF